jgi:hypothetical protein
MTPDPIAYGIIIIFGAALSALFTRLNIKIGNIYVFTLTLWSMGFGLAYPMLVAEEKSVLAYSLGAIGFLFMLASDELFFDYMRNIAPRKSPQTGLESSFSYRLVSDWVIGYGVLNTSNK